MFFLKIRISSNYTQYCCLCVASFRCPERLRAALGRVAFVLSHATDLVPRLPFARLIKLRGRYIVFGIPRRHTPQHMLARVRPRGAISTIESGSSESVVAVPASMPGGVWGECGVWGVVCGVWGGTRSKCWVTPQAWYPWRLVDFVSLDLDGAVRPA